MDCRANSDLFFLSDEKFDFDVSLSPASSNGDEDEVFIGPPSHKERCASVTAGSRLDGGGVRMSWSPLTGDQMDAVCQEAHRLADQLQGGNRSGPQEGDDDEITNVNTDPTDREEFLQDTEAKLGMLGPAATALSPIKRQTFCVQDSPVKQLPPAVQRRLLRGSISNPASSPRPVSAASSTRHASANKTSTRLTGTARRSTSSPVASVKAQPRTGLRGKAMLSVGVVLPSKPAAPATSCSASKSRVEKTRLQPPSKAVGGWKQGPASRPASRAESCEDLLSDSASVASDISDSSLNSSLLGKRTLAPPSKVVRKLPSVKASPLQGRRATERKNTSSSSSSVSSFNSSMSLSPAKGKLNSSLNLGLSGSIGATPSSISRPTNHSRPRRSTAYATAAPTSSTTGRRSLSAQARKPSEVDRVKANRSTPLKKAEATPLQVTPAKRVLEKTVSVPTTARPKSGLNTKPKPEALVLPTPSAGVRGVSHGDEVSKMLKPKRLMSANSVDSLPQTPSAVSYRSLQLKAPRPSALPTPVRRRMSALPVATPTNHTRLNRPPPTSGAGPASAGRGRSCSPAPADTQEAEPVEAPEVQPFCLEVEVDPPAAPPSGPPQLDQSGSTDPGAAPSLGKSEPSRNPMELETEEEEEEEEEEESNSKTQEVLLLDLPAPTLQPQEKLLIDLTNTPVLIRTGSKACTTSQLIDLSSPLIKWSPEDKKENSAPLINLSF